jgi:hypothetical protein
MTQGLSREHELLANLLQHPAWEGILKPVVADQVKLYYSQLVDPSQSRQNRASDDFIRGAIVSLRWVVEYPQAEIDAAMREVEEDVAAAREVAEVIPLFGGGRPGSEIGEAHGRADEGSGGVP